MYVILLNISIKSSCIHFEPSKLDCCLYSQCDRSFSSRNCCCAMSGPVHSRWPRPTPRACAASQMPWSDKLKPARRAKRRMEPQSYGGTVETARRDRPGRMGGPNSWANNGHDGCRRGVLLHMVLPAMCDDKMCHGWVLWKSWHMQDLQPHARINSWF